MGGRIDCYIDLASLYSYIAFTNLLANQELLAAHSVELDFRPVLLGGINAGSGNRPPWTLPAKAKYGIYDGQRSVKRAGLRGLNIPKNIMVIAMTTWPLRALHFIKSHYPRETFHTAFHYLFYCLWTGQNMNITKPDLLRQALAEAPPDFRGAAADSHKDSAPLFSAEEVERIMQAAGSQEMKDSLKATTQQALDTGAFGAPWMLVTNGKGVTEPFFGSDRFHFVYEFLGLPYQDVALLPPSEEGSSKQGSKL